MNWRVAKSLNVLLRQINEKFPNRSISSDGSIGDAAHQASNSDHNAWIIDRSGQRVVSARDFTNDPPKMDSHRLALALIASKDERIKYVIDHSRICSGTGQNHPAWVWRPYNGKNPHDHHVHVSVKSNQNLYDDERPWDISSYSSAIAPDVPKTEPVRQWPLLRVGSHGADVLALQKMLSMVGDPLTLDGDFGPATKKAVQNFQKTHDLVADGIVGPQTWKKLEKIT